MLWILTTRGFGHTVRWLRDYIGGQFARRVQCLPYETLRRRRALPAGAYIFADHERLNRRDFQRACRVAARVRDVDPSAVLLNDPRRVWRRVELLRRLHREGVNAFDVERADTQRVPDQWPVFVRGEQDHDGSASPLLYGPEELAKAIRAERDAGLDLSRRLVVGFAETKSPDGYYRKYGAYRVGDRIIPRHLFLSRDWMVKLTVPPGDFAIEEESAYLQTGPHNARVMELFERAGIQYGRIDYAFAGDRMQVWEINTNPTAIDSATIRIGEQFPRAKNVVPSIADALLDLARKGAGRPRIPLRGVRGVRPRWFDRF